MSNGRQDELDAVLDAALNDYSNREPRTGMDQRILLQVYTGSPARRSSWWIGWALIPVSLAVIAAIAITANPHMPKVRPRVQPQPQVARVTQLPVPSPVPTIATVAKRPAKLRKLERVPEPETLTPGERALLSFARRDPQKARELFADSGQMKELTIDPLKIEALP
jgi:hypothetical protein